MIEKIPFLDAHFLQLICHNATLESLLSLEMDLFTKFTMGWQRLTLFSQLVMPFPSTDKIIVFLNVY